MQGELFKAFIRNYHSKEKNDVIGGFYNTSNNLQFF